MRKLLLILFICFSSIYSLSAQDQTGLFSMAGNISYGTKAESIGIGLRGQYGVIERLRAVGEYKYYIDRRNLSAWGINADAHYVFGVSDAVSLYPLGGVNFSRWTYDPGRANIPGFEGLKKSTNRLGLNLGFGGQIAAGEKTFVMIEAKEALIKNYSQFVITVGFMYQF